MAQQRNRHRERISYADLPYTYEGNAVRKPMPEYVEEAPRRKKKPVAAPKVRRSELSVREPGKISPFAVVGMLSICLLTVVLLAQYVELVAVNDEAVVYKNQLTDLREEAGKLEAQYQLSFDLQAIEAELLGSGEMVRASETQVHEIHMVQPDEVVYYEANAESGGLLDSVKQIFSVLGTYF